MNQVIDPSTLQTHTHFQVRQRIRPMVNRYEIWAGETFVAVAQQKRLAFKEQVTFYADEDRTTPVFGFKARQAIDAGATYDVVAADGSSLGYFRKNFGQSLLRSTWHLGQAGVECTGQERDQVVALLRRFSNLSFLPYHFDFATDDARPVFTVDRRWAVRDTYDVTIQDPTVDRRLVCALAVALDALQGR